VPSFRASPDVWAKQRSLHETRGDGPKVAYFTGCTARYLFPEVAKATVEVLERNGVAVYVPPQRCCGMPSMLEGDRVPPRRRPSPRNLAGPRLVTTSSAPATCAGLKAVQPADAMHTPGSAPACAARRRGRRRPREDRRALRREASCKAAPTRCSSARRNPTCA
jgi:glycerol-3-phosphate dehydrogenase subunit C